jgi:hypothetical protein
MAVPMTVFVTLGMKFSYNHSHQCHVSTHVFTSTKLDQQRIELLRNQAPAAAYALDAWGSIGKSSSSLTWLSHRPITHGSTSRMARLAVQEEKKDNFFCQASKIFILCKRAGIFHFKL